MIFSKFNQFKWFLLLVALSILLSCTQRDTHSGGEAGVYMSEVQAFRLLEQATFGPMDSEVKVVQSLGPVQWVENQLNAGSAYQSSSDSHQTHLQRYKAIAKMAEPSTYSKDTDFNNNFHGRTSDYQTSVWFENILHGKDQLRQRVAFALTYKECLQIVVITRSETLRSRGKHYF